MLYRSGGRGPAGPAIAGPLFSQNCIQSTYSFPGVYKSRTTSITAGPLLSQPDHFHLAVSGLAVRLQVWPWQQVCLKPVQKWGVRATWIFIMTSPVYWLQCGGHTQVILFGPPESTVNWPGRRREEGGSELIAHMGKARHCKTFPQANIKKSTSH